MDFIRELQRQSSKVRVETLGTSAEGKQIPMLVIGDPASLLAGRFEMG